jgi:hypothetical protein
MGLERLRKAARAVSHFLVPFACVAALCGSLALAFGLLGAVLTSWPALLAARLLLAAALVAPLYFAGRHLAREAGVLAPTAGAAARTDNARAIAEERARAYEAELLAELDAENLAKSKPKERSEKRPAAKRADAPASLGDR